MAPDRRLTPLRRAELAVDAAAAGPVRALDEARDVLLSTADAEAACVAHRALGLALRELGEVNMGVRHLRTAVRIAEEAGLTVRAAQSRLSLVVPRAEQGCLDDALAIADEALPSLTGLDRHRLAVQRATVIARQGGFAEAIEALDPAVRALSEPGGDPRFLTGALINRAIARAEIGDHPGAERDLVRCRETALAAGYHHIADLALGNLAFVAARRGDLPATYARYQEAESALGAYPERLAALRIDLAGALLAMHLPDEARAMLGSAVNALIAAGAGASLAEARMLLAQAELIAGLPARARETAATAWAALVEQNRYGWALLAQQTEVRARFALGEVDAELLANAQSCSAELAVAGWAVAADHVRIVAARLAWRLGFPAIAETELAAVLRIGDPSPGIAGMAVRWQATALLRLLRGNGRGAFAAVAAGLRAIAGRSAGTGDLRAHVACWGEELAGVAMGPALRSRSARRILGWEERRRAVAGGLSPGGGPTVPGPELAALRHATHVLYQEMNNGTAGRVAALSARRDHLEEVLRRRLRGQAHGSARHDQAAFDVARLRATLDGVTLIEYVQHADELTALVVDHRACRLRRAGSLPAVTELIARIRFGLRRLAIRDTTAEGLRSVRLGVARDTAALDDLLVGQARGLIGDRELVIVPSAGLRLLPWAALPTLRRRPLSVAASATAWLAARERADEPAYGEVVVAAGPGLDLGGAETTDVAKRHPGARVLTGPAATADAVRLALDGASVAHIAAHGEFRADSPLMTGLRLADGLLMGYDLLRLRRAPALTVLSACDAGLSAAPAEGSSLGIAGTLLGRKGACVIASVTPVADAVAPALMAAFHERIAAGHTAAQALAAAVDDPDLSGFACFGAGSVRIT